MSNYVENADALARAQARAAIQVFSGIATSKSAPPDLVRYAQSSREDARKNIAMMEAIPK
ncbi:MAG: hypothetical protein JO343_04275 [Candidatus Eremiobacteraeota bacterium]|nr:hypothetical protein [Candidatus Eremiobacteraeota bacterium]